MLKQNQQKMIDQLETTEKFNFFHALLFHPV